MSDLESRLKLASEDVASAAIKNKEEYILNPRFQRIEKEFELMIPLFAGRISNLEEDLKDRLSTLEDHVRELVSRSYDNEEDIERKLNAIIGAIEQIKLVTPARLINFHSDEEYQPEEEYQSEEDANEDSEEYKSLEEGITRILQPRSDDPKDLSKVCALFFSIFPERSVIKKRPLIYWWIGEGLIKDNKGKTADEVGEELFKQLIDDDVIFAKFDNEWNRIGVANKCEMHPRIRIRLIKEARFSKFFAFDSTGAPSCVSLYDRACLDSRTNWYEFQEGAAKYTAVFNVNQQYPTLRVGWLGKLKRVRVLQLGQLEDSVEYYVEMEDESLKDLGGQMLLKYLSLRGISKITELPSSIINLSRLEILDVRACQNLERLPDKIASLSKLTHLDVSECYFLERMPKGIENLHDLQVLKGFVVGHSYENSCKICDLLKLKKLRKLSIRIGKMVITREEKFEKLNEIASLRRLKISWEGNLNMTEFGLSFPLNLEKLDLRAIPLEEAPAWLHPSKLKNLKKLYIIGGELGSLDRRNTNNGKTSGWKVETLYLKYLKKLKITLPEVLGKFPDLLFLEKIECHVNDEDIVWDKSEGVIWPKRE